MYKRLEYFQRYIDNWLTALAHRAVSGYQLCNHMNIVPLLALACPPICRYFDVPARISFVRPGTHYHVTSLYHLGDLWVRSGNESSSVFVLAVMLH